MPELSTIKCDSLPPDDVLAFGDVRVHSPDPLLIQRILSGDEGAFRLLHDRYAKGIFSLCLGYTKGDRAQAHDLCQEAFISAFENLGQLRNAGSFPYWLNEIAKNKCISHKRKEITLASALKDYEVINWAMGDAKRDWSAAELQLVVDIIHGMEESDIKETVQLYYVEGRNSREVSEILGITQTLVTTRLNRFRARFRKRIMREILNLRDPKL